MLRLDWNLLFTVINLLFLYFLMKKFLFGRVNKVIEERRQLIEKQFADAKAAQDTADELKAEYETKLAAAGEERENILAQAKAQAQAESGLAETDAELEQKRRRAEADMAVERANALREMKSEIASLVIDAAAKVVDDQDTKDTIRNDRKLYDKFIAEAGEANGVKIQ